MLLSFLSVYYLVGMTNRVAICLVTMQLLGRLMFIGSF